MRKGLGLAAAIEAPRMTGDDVRRLASSLAEATEQDHHGFPSFRVGGKIFATLPDDDHLNVMLDADSISAAAGIFEWCEEQWWGRRLTALRVTLAEADEAPVAEWLEEAWRRRAPKRLR